MTTASCMTTALSCSPEGHRPRATPSSALGEREIRERRQIGERERGRSGERVEERERKKKEKERERADWDAFIWGHSSNCSKRWLLTNKIMHVVKKEFPITIVVSFGNFH